MTIDFTVDFLALKERHFSALGEAQGYERMINESSVRARQTSESFVSAKRSFQHPL